MKKIFILFIVVLIVGLAGCSNERYGEINKIVKTTVNKTSENEDVKRQYNPTSTNLEYNFEMVNVGRANLQFPCPDTWEVERSTDHNICLKAPANDPYFPGCRIYFHCYLQTNNLVNQNYVATEKQIIYMYGDLLSDDQYVINGNVYTKDMYSTVDKMVINTKISDPAYNRQITYRDWDASLRTSSGRSIDGYYHQSTGFWWHEFPGVFAGVVPNEQADQFNELLLYMMSNMNYIEDTIEDTQKVSGFKSGFKFDISPLYEDAEVNNMGDAKTVFHSYCPGNSGTAFSDSFITIYEFNNKDFKKLNEENVIDYYLDIFSENVFDATPTEMGVEGVYVEKFDGAYRMWNDQKVMEAACELTPLGYGRFGAEKWRFCIWAIEGEEYTDVVVLTSNVDAVPMTMNAINTLFDRLSN